MDVTVRLMADPPCIKTLTGPSCLNLPLSSVWSPPTISQNDVLNSCTKLILSDWMVSSFSDDPHLTVNSSSLIGSSPKLIEMSPAQLSSGLLMTVAELMGQYTKTLSHLP